MTARQAGITSPGGASRPLPRLSRCAALERSCRRTLLGAIEPAQPGRVSHHVTGRPSTNARYPPICSATWSLRWPTWAAPNWVFSVRRQGGGREPNPADSDCDWPEYHRMRRTRLHRHRYKPAVQRMRNHLPRPAAVRRDRQPGHLQRLHRPDRHPVLPARRRQAAARAQRPGCNHGPGA
jgi:hypothetical protein